MGRTAPICARYFRASGDGKRESAGVIHADGSAGEVELDVRVRSGGCGRR